MKPPITLISTCIFFFVAQSCAHAPYVKTVDRLVKTKNADYRNCFDTVYAKESVGVTDGLRLQWVVAANGEPTQITAQTQTKLGYRLGICIAKVVGTLRFAEPDKPTLIRYPFVFTKRKPEVDSNF